MAAGQKEADHKPSNVPTKAAKKKKACHRIGFSGIYRLTLYTVPSWPLVLQTNVLSNLGILWVQNRLHAGCNSTGIN
eukprot:2402490-Amphidinium_carterae.1